MSGSAVIYIKKLRRRFLLTTGAETLLWGAGCMLVFSGLIRFLQISVEAVWITAILAGFVMMFVKARRAGLFSVSYLRIVQFLNNKYPALEDSADLLLKQDNEINLLQKIQQRKVKIKFDALYPSIEIRTHLLQSALIFTGSFAFFLALSSFDKKNKDADLVSGQNLEEKKNVWKDPRIKSLNIQISPPGYTKIKSYLTNDPNLEIIEGSKVTWELTLTEKVRNCFIVFAGDTARLTGNKKYSLSRTFDASAIYLFSWQTSTSEVLSSDYYKIQVNPDKAPNVSIINLPQFQEYAITDNPNFHINTRISDDFGLSDGYIVATVSKGSGESVKFREVKLLFDSPLSFAGKNLQASAEIDLKKMGLDPGDELYFYVEALDNKQPKKNRSRTETFFVLLKDTARDELSIEGGMGVDLMPEYFRSQRQIIIDSEKLLRERKTISKQEFSSRSNELGYDQKVLRLKYGEFLGEEFESGIGPASAVPDREDQHEEGEEEEEEEKDVVKQYGHQHDTENEHHALPEKKVEIHQHEEQSDEDDKNPMSEFLHSHDNAEEATFFAQSIRAKLKAALNEMWDAELHLRIFDPQRSLPYQYRALKLLKEISNDARIYVHKTGFDPPPVKEEKRMTGDLTELRDTRYIVTAEEPVDLPAIRKALHVTEKLLSEKKAIQEEDKVTLRQSGVELARLALKEPGRYLEALSVIKALNEDRMENVDWTRSVKLLRANLWQALPATMVYPDASTRGATNLERKFIENLGKLKNE